MREREALALLPQKVALWGTVPFFMCCLMVKPQANNLQC